MTKKYKSEAFESIHQSAKALHAVGAISKTTLREYDEACLSMPDQIPAEQIKQLRESSHVSPPSKNGSRERNGLAAWRSNY